jgi:hypothetical protein
MRVSRPTESIPPYVPETEPGQAPAGRETNDAAPSAFGRLLRGLGQELDRGEAVTAKAIRGGSGAGMSPEALIALQAGIYRYSEAVDLVTKLVDRATQAVKTTIQNQ